MPFISIPYRSYSNEHDDYPDSAALAISIPYRSYSNFFIGIGDWLGKYISIPYRSYSNESGSGMYDLYLKFQSLIGLILTNIGPIRPLFAIVFQSLIGLILTRKGRGCLLSHSRFQSLIGLILTALQLKKDMGIDISIPYRSYSNAERPAIKKWE